MPMPWVTTKPTLSRQCDTQVTVTLPGQNIKWDTPIFSLHPSALLRPQQTKYDSY